MLRKFRDKDGKLSLIFILQKIYIKAVFEVKDISVIRLIRYLSFIVKIVFKKGLIFSVRKRSPQLRDGTPIPWVTHSFLDYVSRLNLKNMKMIEFGSGNSTIFFAKRVRDLVSYEHDLTYISLLRNQYNYRGKIIHVDHQYAGVLSDFEADIVFIDGLDRNGLLKTLLKFISSNSQNIPQIVMIDNPDFIDQNILSELVNSGFMRIDFYGFVSANFNEGISSLFFSKMVKRELFESSSFETYVSLFN